MARSRSPSPNQVGSTPYAASSSLTLPGLVAPAPAALGVDAVAERVHHGVEVGADLEPVEPHVVGGVGDDGDLGVGRDSRQGAGARCRAAGPGGTGRRPTPPESTVICRMRGSPCRTRDNSPISGGCPAIPDPGLTFGVRQACNSHSVLHSGCGPHPARSADRQSHQGHTGRRSTRVERASAVRELLLLDGDAEEAGWQERALCAQTDPEAFFPEKGGSTREAKKVCLTCDVRGDCLEYALDERRALRHLGRSVRARAPQAEEARGLGRDPARAGPRPAAYGRQLPAVRVIDRDSLGRRPPRQP